MSKNIDRIKRDVSCRSEIPVFWFRSALRRSCIESKKLYKEVYIPWTTSFTHPAITSSIYYSFQSTILPIIHEQFLGRPLGFDFRLHSSRSNRRTTSILDYLQSLYKRQSFIKMVKNYEEEYRQSLEVVESAVERIRYCQYRVERAEQGIKDTAARSNATRKWSIGDSAGHSRAYHQCLHRTQG